MCHLSGSGHPRTREKLWARATRWTKGLRPAWWGWGLHRLGGSQPWPGQTPLPLGPVWLCGGMGQHALYPQGLLSCVRSTSCAER